MAFDFPHAWWRHRDSAHGSRRQPPRRRSPSAAAPSLSPRRPRLLL